LPILFSGQFGSSETGSGETETQFDTN